MKLKNIHKLYNYIFSLAVFPYNYYFSFILQTVPLAIYCAIQKFKGKLFSPAD